MAYIQLNKANYFHNLSVISKRAGSKEKVAVVLKDNAYGHGLIEIAKLANEFGIKNAVVRTVAEAKKIETFFSQILILADTDIHTYSHTFHIVINSIEDIQRLPENSNVHLKIDTGMHRNGIQMDSLESAISGLSKKKLNLIGVMTHFRSADELSCDFFWQSRNFIQVKNEVKRICEKLFLPIPKFHCANSAALFRFKNYEDDLVRVGIAQYGYTENHYLLEQPDLKPVLSLWGKKVATRKIKKNQKVGYGGMYMAKEDMTISTYDVGYGDGFFRLNGMYKCYTPKGYEILGRVSMDSLSINCDDEKVCIFNDARQLAKIHNTITYEITTSLNPNIPKEIV